MATLDDKLLGEKLHYYCSSSEDEGDDDNEDGARGGGSKGEKAPKFVPEKDLPRNDGTANTGPKGVLADWRRFKQLEKENREDQAAEKAELCKRLAMTCRTDKEDQQAKLDEQKVDDDLETLLDDDYLREYMEKRMREMMTSSVSTKIFGHLSDLSNGEEFLDAIDKEDKSVNVVIFIYEDGAPGCEPMHKGLEKVAKDYPVTKFCRVRASSLPKLSRDFKLSGVPALLVYRAGEMVTNFVGMTQSLGDDFFASDIESFLVEHAVIADKELVPSIVRGPANTNDDDSDSD